jgi:signal recognition particle GTPase
VGPPILQQDVEEMPLEVDESVDPEDVDVDKMAEEIQEGLHEEDVGFDVVENITTDVYKQKHQECEQKKLKLIESCYSVTCKSGGNELLWTVVPDLIADSSIMEFQIIGVWQME